MGRMVYKTMNTERRGGAGVAEVTTAGTKDQAVGIKWNSQYLKINNAMAVVSTNKKKTFNG